jgi:putative PEP-CTERM system TPR-repeat lipoprotein
VYLIKGDNANARAAFEKAIALQPTFFPAVTNLARLDLMENKPDAAKQRFQKVLEKDKNNFGAMSSLGDLAMAQKKTDEATSWYEKASAANPDAVVPALKLGTHYLHIQQPQKALALARKLQTANPTNPELLDLLGQAQVATKDVSGALDTYSKLVNVVPKSPQAQMRLAGVHMLMKNDAEAAADLKRAVSMAPDFMPARLAQIQLAVRANHFDDALNIAHDVQKSNPKSPAGFAVEGDLMMAQHKPAQATAAYDKALAVHKSSEVFVKSLMSMTASGKGKEAQARAQQWLKDNPTDQGVGRYVAETSLANKDFKQAIATMQDLLKSNPNDPVLLNNLAWVYQQQKDPRALETAEQAFKVAGDNPGVMDTLGWMLVEQGNTARGLPLLQKAGALAPNAPEIHYHLAVGLNKSGDKQGARKELEKLLAQNQSFAQADEARTLLKTL